MRRRKRRTGGVEVYAKKMGGLRFGRLGGGGGGEGKKTTTEKKEEEEKVLAAEKKTKTTPKKELGEKAGGKKEEEVKTPTLSPLEVLRRENELLREARRAEEEAVNAVTKAGEKLKAATSAANGNGNGKLPSAVSAKTPTQYDGWGRESNCWSPIQYQPPSHEMEDPHGLAPDSLYESEDGTGCFRWDESLWRAADHFRYRFARLRELKRAILENEGGMDKFSRGYEKMGFNKHVTEDGVKGIIYREWAPGARAAALVGDFNAWEPRPEHWMTRGEYGVWELFLPNGPGGEPAIPHRSKVKVRLETDELGTVDRIPAWISWATQEWNEVQFNGCYWDPPTTSAPGVFEDESKYTFKYERPQRPRSLRVYECHVGMSSEEPRINTYLDFKDNVLPRIRDLGYNAIQIMAVQEHAYYGSFGYHVTNFFAVSSRCGTPEELKAMIDEAHRLGIVVLMDIVHSHASKNAQDGINMFDGSDHQYFHSGGAGYHWMWDSRLFNYGNWEVLRFLLSNCRWWMDEYKFDGFRFDGVTSMMYKHHGLQMAFTGNYDEYFGMATDVDAVVYLMLANDMIHSLFPTAVTIGEDVSGMPSFCRPVPEGGVGFDYRLQMAIADKWIDILGGMGDESWDMGDIVHTLTNRRYGEKCVAYAESHDQALVGDKTIAFWLMDAAMYDCMAADSQSGTVDRGIALHKMIRGITIALGGNSYLNFMGNEFGHPEWIDFPRDDFVDPGTGNFVPGNGGSLDKARRRFDLADADYLKYKFMNSFDRALMHLDKAYGFVAAEHEYVSRKDNGDKVVVAERGDLVFVFNFHWNSSYTDYKVGCLKPGDYKLVLSSDEAVHGGYGNASIFNDTTFVAHEGDAHDNRPSSFMCYLPSRTMTVYAPAETVDCNDALNVPGIGVKAPGPYYEF